MRFMTVLTKIATPLLTTAILGVTQPAGASNIQGSDAPWSAPTPRIVRSDLTFISGAARLSGTLYLPASRKRSPVVVVYHGASDALRTAPLYRHLVEMLPSLGIGVFVYDRRGSGMSTGPSAGGSYAMLADDGIAARHALANLPSVDPRRMGYWGLSQGGWLAALAAERDPGCAFAISISAPMATADVQMQFAVANILRIKGFDQQAIDLAIDARLAVDQFMRGEVDRPTAQRRLDAAASQPWFDLIYLSRSFKDPDKSDWAAEMRNDPMAVVSRVRKPLLIVYGSADPWVPVSASLQRLAAAGLRKETIDVRVIAGADHAMMTSATPLAQVDPPTMAHQAPEAPEYFAMLTRWLLSMGVAADPLDRHSQAGRLGHP